MRYAMTVALLIAEAFQAGWKNQPLKRDCVRKDKRIRTYLNEKQIDKMLEDSFPASDPPSTY
jgi:hypothetical protein